MEKLRKSRFLLFIFGLIVIGCDGNVLTEKEVIETYPVIKLEKVNTNFTREYVADIVAHQNIELRSQMQGFLTKIHKDEGSKVKEGQLLFTIKNDRKQADLAIEEANLKNAIAVAKTSELAVKQVQQLVDKDVVSALELELAKAKYQADLAKIEEAEFRTENARTLVGFSNIRAPFTGTIDRIMLKRGSTVNYGDLLTRLTDNSIVYAYFYLSEVEYLRFMKMKEQDKNIKDVGLILADGTRHNDVGEIETMGSTIDDATGTISIRAVFDNPERVLKHGSTAKVVLSTALTDVVVVPQKCTFDVQDRSYVYVLNKDGIVEQRRFSYLYRIEDFYVVNEGLKTGDVVVFSGLQELRHGVKIKADMHEYQPNILF